MFANDNDDDGDAEMNRIEANIAANPEQLRGGDAEEQQEEVPDVPRENSVKLVFRMFCDQRKISNKNLTTTLLGFKIFCNFLFSLI